MSNIERSVIVENFWEVFLPGFSPTLMELAWRVVGSAREFHHWVNYMRVYVLRSANKNLESEIKDARGAQVGMAWVGTNKGGLLLFVDLEPDANWAHRVMYIQIGEVETSWCIWDWPPSQEYEMVEIPRAPARAG
jgi:hypothetical protein